MEVDYLNGEIVLLGRLHDVPTPVNELLQHATHRAVADGTPPGTIPAADLLAAARLTPSEVFRVTRGFPAQAGHENLGWS